MKREQTFWIIHFHHIFGGQKKKKRAQYFWKFIEKG
jgi:hypothetical protein